MRWTIVVMVSLSIGVAGAGWGYAQQKKAAGMLTPQDYNEIQQLYANYSQALDKGQGERFAALFTPDGEFTSGRPPGRGNEARTPLKGTERLTRMGSVGGRPPFHGQSRHYPDARGRQWVVLPAPVQRAEHPGDDHRDGHLSGHARQDPARLALQQARRVARR